MHSELKKVVKNADTAFLFIHGIAGTPRHFDAFVDALPDNISVLNILLDGHGKGVKDFSNASMKKWEQQVNNAINTLSLDHKNIYIIAHSMGTLFALDEATKSAKIKGLFLLSVPLKLSIKGKMISNALKVYFNKISPEDLIAISAKKCYGIKDSKNPFLYLGWLPRYVELFKKSKEICNIIEEINVPTIAFQSRTDEMVSLKTVDILRKNPNINVEILENSCHFHYDKNDFAFLIEEFKKIKA